MENGYFQKTISSLSIAVLTGVVLFSVGSGTSASPEYSPPGTGVRPTFTGAIITGDIENPQGNVVVGGNFQVKKIPGSALDKGDLTVDGGVYLNNAGNGGINLGATDGTSKIYVRGALDFLTTDTTKNVINHLLKIISHDTVNGLVFQAPGVRITLSPNKGVSITNEASLGSSNGSKDLKGEMNVTVQGNIDLTGKIKDTAGDGTIKLENNLDVLGQVTAKSLKTTKIYNGPLGEVGDANVTWVQVDDKFAVTQNSNFKGNVVIENTLSVWDAVNSSNGLIQTNKIKSGSIDATGAVTAGSLNVKMGLQVTQGMTFAYVGSKPTADAYESFIYHDSSGPNAKDDNLVIQSNDNIKLVTNPSWGAGPGTVEIIGHLKASSIGVFERVKQKFDSTLNENTYAESSIACPTGSFIVSCSAQSYSKVYYTNLDPYITDNKCYAGGYSMKGNAKFRPIAMCFWPNK